MLSSIFGFLSRVGRLPYAMSKHALVGVVKTLALELAADGVLVNAVSPGLHRHRPDPGQQRRSHHRPPHVGHPVAAGWGRPDEIAEVVYFSGSTAIGISPVKMWWPTADSPSTAEGADPMPTFRIQDTQFEAVPGREAGDVLTVTLVPPAL